MNKIQIQVALLLLLTFGPIISSAGASNGTTKYIIVADILCGWKPCRVENPQPKQWVSYKGPVPYAACWDNPLRQTAQQCVAILSLFEAGQDQTVNGVIKEARQKLYEQRRIDKIKEGMRTDRYGPTTYVNNSATNTWTAIGLAIICIGSFLVLFWHHALSNIQNQRKFWKQQKKSI